MDVRQMKRRPYYASLRGSLPHRESGSRCRHKDQAAAFANFSIDFIRGSARMAPVQDNRIGKPPGKMTASELARSCELVPDELDRFCRTLRGVKTRRVELTREKRRLQIS